MGQSGLTGLSSFDICAGYRCGEFAVDIHFDSFGSGVLKTIVGDVHNGVELSAGSHADRQ